MKGQIYWYCK